MTDTPSSADPFSDSEESDQPTTTATDDEKGFQLKGIMVPSVFGEGGPSTPSVGYLGRKPKKIGLLAKDKFLCFEYDIDFKELDPYLLNLQSLYLTELTSIELYHNISYLDLTYNKLSNAGIANLVLLENLVTLILDHNKVKSTRLPVMPNLIYLSMNKNLFLRMHPINQPNVEFLFLNENRLRQINHVDSNSLPKLKVLSICHCYLLNMMANYSETLERLYLSYNRIRKIEGLRGLVNLKILHLRGNKIKTLIGFSNDLFKLYYINLRENEVSENQQFKYLQVLPMLRILILTGNPIDESMERNNIREAVLINSPNMRRINKYLVKDAEIENAKAVKERMSEERKRAKIQYEQLSGEGG